MTPLIHRPATRDDAPLLVDVVQMAGHGLPEMTWAEMAQDGETVRDVGLRRAARDDGAFSWTNARIVERGDDALGVVVGYPLPNTPVEIGPEFPAPFVPLQELENMVPGAWYVNIIAVRPEARGEGVGRAMMQDVEDRARANGHRMTALIVSSESPEAQAFYRSLGYAEVARRKMAFPGWALDGSEEILMTKTL